MGSHSFTCHSHTNHTCLYSPAVTRKALLPFGRYLLQLYQPMKGWPGWVDLDDISWYCFQSRLRVCLPLHLMLWLSDSLPTKFIFSIQVRTGYSESECQGWFHIPRSLGQGQGHRSKRACLCCWLRLRDNFVDIAHSPFYLFKVICISL